MRGNAKRARRLLERAFAADPYPDITAAYLAFAEGEGDALVHDRLRLATRLLERAPDALEARLAAADAAVAAGLWGKARKHLDDAEAGFAGAAEGQGAPARLYRLRARLIEAEGGDAREAGKWLLRAAAGRARRELGVQRLRHGGAGLDRPVRHVPGGSIHWNGAHRHRRGARHSQPGTGRDCGPAARRHGAIDRRLGICA